MAPIKIPDICKPGLDITLGYSGGMALYVADWESVMYLFQLTNVPLLAYYTIETTLLN
jgi:hypothetical protein